MALILHEHPFASYCWKVLISLYEREVPFEARIINDQADRERLAGIWPMGSIPVLVDEGADLTLPESTTIIEYLDRQGEAAPMIPAEPAAALKARLWDRIFDGHVMTPMQKIVADALRPVAERDRYGVSEARAALDRAYAMLDDHLAGGGWAAGDGFGLADCAAAPSLFYARVVHGWDEEKLSGLTRYYEAVRARPSVSRVIEEAREYRSVFPLPWPDHAD